MPLHVVAGRAPPCFKCILQLGGGEHCPQCLRLVNINTPIEGEYNNVFSSVLKMV